MTLISARAFEVSSSLSALLRKHVTRVTLDGFAIQIPPGDVDADSGERGSRLGGLPRPGMNASLRQVVIDELIADNATLTILPRRPDRPPKVWRMHELHLQSVGPAQAMPFRSVLTNGVPPGEIDTAGTFGPWNVDDPGATPIEGTFTFDQADLSVFKGIAGTLSSHGDFTGSLERLVVRGRTSTPDFTVTIGAHPMPLDTIYSAVVDATNGDTTLDRIDATFLNTSLVATGGVYGKSGVRGRQVELVVTMDAGRLEDVLQLVVNTPKPTMLGGLQLQTRMEIPPGDRDIVDKLRLAGTFHIAGGHFTDPGVQTRINSLSRRAQGKPGDESIHVTSDFTGTFALGNGRLALRPLRFDVPGALVELVGNYGLRDGSLALAGDVLFDAKMSQAVGGWKAFLLKPVDPLFRRNGRTFVPVTIGGFRGAPKFGFDRGRLFNRDAPPRPPAVSTPDRPSR